MVAGALVNGNAVNDVALAEVFEHPKEMLRSDAEHRRADANAGIERDDFVVLQFLAEAVDEVDLRADGPFGARGRSLDGFDDAFGGADLIGGLGDLEAAFRVRDDANTGMLAADALDLLRCEALVHGAIALPEDDARAANRFRRVSAKFLVRIPDDHLFERDAHAIAGVAAEVLVGEEENFFARLEGPVHDRGCVGAGADRAAPLTGKGFDGRGRIHVGDGDDFARIEERREFAPAGFHLPDVGHIGHGATSVEVWQDNHLVLTAKNVRAFGHEVHAAKDDIAALGLRRLEGELEGVTAEISKLDDFVALVVMAQDHDVPAKTGLRGRDAVVERIVRHQEVGIEVAPYSGFDFRRAEGGRLFSTNKDAAIRNGYEVAHGVCCVCLEADTKRSLIPAWRLHLPIVEAIVNYPPINTMVREGGMKPGSLMRWPSSFSRT